MIYSGFIATPLGTMTAAAKDDALIGLWFAGQRYYPPEAGTWREESCCTVFEALRAWLADYFAGKKPELKIPLAPQGTPFQKSVWEQLLKIPYGQASTYGALAEKLASGTKNASARAVGGAVGRNPISILIPCHRVLGAGGALTGYAGGLEKKTFLLKLEGAEL